MSPPSGETPEQLELFSGQEVPTRYTYCEGRRRSKFNFPSIIPRLGKAPDTQLAKEIGTQTKRVWRLRRELGIPAYDYFTPFVHLLGKESDAALARLVGVSRQTIRKRRLTLGIPRADVKAANAAAQLREYVDHLKS